MRNLALFPFLFFLFSTFYFLPSIAQADITTSLVGYWNFDEGSGIIANDSSGNGNNGTLMNNASFDPSAAVGISGISFTGGNSYINVPQNSSLNIMGPITISAWVYATTTADAQEVINKKSDSTNYGYRLNTAWGKVRFSWGNSQNTFYEQTNETIPANSWTHITASYDQQNVKLYINGQLKKTISHTESIASSGGVGILIGNYSPSNLNVYAFKGKIDDARIYNRALTDEEVQSVYAYNGDTSAPFLLNGTPSGILPSGTNSTELSVSTNETAVCMYSTTPNQTYSSMSNTLSASNGQYHSVNISGLTEGVSYNYYIKCQDVAGNENQNDYIVSFSIQGGTPPSIPGEIKAIAISASRVFLSWKKSTDNAGVAGYNIYRNGVLASTTTQTSFYDLNLTPSTDYNYAVNAYDISGNASDMSSVNAKTHSITSKEMFYGIPLTTQGLSNLQIGRYVDRASIRFKAEKDGTLKAVKIVLIFETSEQATKCSPGNCYGNGNGGKLRIEIQTDDGTVEHLPSGNVLAYATIDDPMNSNRNAPVYGTSSGIGSFPYIENFNTFPQFEKDKLYHIVFKNTDPDPFTNYVSLNSMYNLFYGLGGNDRQAHFNDTDKALIYKNTTGVWSTRYMENPTFEVYYQDNFVQGQGYMGTRVSTPKPIYGAKQARQTFSPDKDRTVSAVFVRLKKTGNPGLLTVKIEDSTGNVVQTGTIEDSLFNDTSYNWANYILSPNVILLKDKTYYVTLSAAAGDGSNYYNIYPVQDGNRSGYGFSAYSVFSDGQAKYTDDGVNWPDNTSDDWSGMSAFDYQLFFTVVDNELPSVPTNFQINAISTSQTSLSWSTSTDNIYISGYKIYRDGAEIATTQNTSYTDTNLSPNTNYSYQVSAYDSSGNESAKSASISVTTQSNSASTANIGTTLGNGPIPGTINPSTTTSSTTLFAITATTTAASATPTLISNATSSTYNVDEKVFSNTQPVFIKPIKPNSPNDQIKQLQQFLSQDKEIYPEGKITGYYGNLTKKAVQRFQCKHNIICSGNEQTTGYGIVGPKTIAKLNEIYSKTKIQPSNQTPASSSGSSSSSSQNFSLRQLVELLIFTGVIAPDKADLARTSLKAIGM